jgi:hypothetical protein
LPKLEKAGPETLGIVVLTTGGNDLIHSYGRNPPVEGAMYGATPDAFLGHGIPCSQRWRTHYRRDDPHYRYFDNLEDPNPRGYDAIRRLFLLEIQAVLAPK